MKVLKKYKFEDIYDGIIVASIFNSGYLYEIKLDVDNFKYRPIAEMVDGMIRMVTRDWYPLSNSQIKDLCETTTSRSLNLPNERNEKLKKIGI